MKTIDLHVHTTASDGTVEPSAIAGLAKEAGLSAIAVTDHDTVSGVVPAQEAGKAAGVEIFAGIEISTTFRGTEIHLLGYGIDTAAPSLEPVLNYVEEDRRVRNEKIVAMLARDGYAISMEQLKKDYPDTVLGRPHIAETLLRGGYVESIKDAFNRFLADGKPYFLPRNYLPFDQAAEAIRGAGGIPVLAHPLQYKFDEETLEAFVDEGVRNGVKGLEVYYSGYTAEETRKLAAMAEKRGLILTGGSDFHGTRKPDIALGTGTGTLAVPEALLAPLKEAIAGAKA